MKLTSSQIKKYNKIADAGKKPIMVRVGSKWYTWYEGDPKYGVFLTTQSGKDVEFDFKQIDDIQESKMTKMKSKLREIIREEIQKLNEGKNIFTTKIKGMEKNTITFSDEPHEDGTYFGVRVNRDNVGVVIVHSDGNITVSRHKNKIKLK